MKKTSLSISVAIGAIALPLTVLDIAHMALLDRDPLIKLKFKASEGKGLMPVERSKLDEAEEKGFEWFKSQDFQTLHMTNTRGQTLCAYYIPPKGGVNTIVFLSHGFGSTAFRDPMIFVRHYYEKYGFGLFIVDHTACGNSEGKYIGFSGFESTDSVNWLHYINSRLGNFKIIIHGVSMGAATVLRMCGDKELPHNVIFCVSDCGFTGAYDQLIYEMKLMHLPAHPSVDIFDAINLLKAHYSIKNDCDVVGSVRDSKIPILFIHGDKDTFVNTDMVYTLYDACPTDKDLLIVKGATHAASCIYDPYAYWEKVDAFIKKYDK